VLALALAPAAAGCGTGSAAAPAATHAQSVPPGWRTATTAAGLTLAYPPAWSPLGGDPGSLSAVVRGPDGNIAGYLNLTPRSGAERAANWVSFRPQHERGEGDRDVRVLASRTMRLRGGPAVCVEDSYSTRTNARYVELACLVEGARPAVVLGAAPPQQWRATMPVIERALTAAVT
jgi:hypothetical protein